MPERKVLEPLKGSVSRVLPCPRCPTGACYLAVSDSTRQGTEVVGADGRLGSGAERAVGAHPVYAVRWGVV